MVQGKLTTEKQRTQRTHRVLQITTLPSLSRFASLAFEILHGSFVLLGRSPRIKRAEVFAFACFRILLPRVEPILARLQLSNHLSTLLVSDRASVSVIPRRLA